MCTSRIAGVDRNQLDSIILDVLEMYNLTVNTNEAHPPCPPMTGREGETRVGVEVEERKTITEPSQEPGNNGWDITFTLLMTPLHSHHHIPFVLLLLKEEYWISRKH